MADDGASGAGGSTAMDGSDGPESATIEINIKTLESQVHKLRVAKNETVLNLKEKIVDVAGIPVEQQRLIFRGRVLKDDHLLSEYRKDPSYVNFIEDIQGEVQGTPSVHQRAGPCCRLPWIRFDSHGSELQPH